MQQLLTNKFTIPLIIFFVSFAIFGFNLEGQGITIDEWFHHGFSMTFFDLTKEGDVLDSCITLDGDCEKIDLTCPGPIHRIGSGGIVKGLLIGFGDFLFSDNDRIYYTSTEHPCRPIHKDIHEPGVNIPTQDELAAARFFTPIFSSLTLVVGFLLGKLLFNRNIGLMFSLILLFHTLWFHFSRTILSEIYVSFFVLLSIYLLFYASRNHKFDYKYCILSAMIFALGINTKFTALFLLPIMLIIIVFNNSWQTKIDLKTFKKLFSKQVLYIMLLFSGILCISIIATFPYYWVDPIGQTLFQFDAMKNDNYGAVTIGLDKKIILPFVESATIAPIIDGYYYLFSPSNIPESAKSGHTFSSIPLSIFFIVGLFWIFKRIKQKEITYAELMIFAWYVVAYIPISIFTESYNASRHFLPIIFPMILIMSYGVDNFLKDIKTSIRKIFWIIILISHSLTYLVFWEIIYFKPELMWNLPLTVNLRLSLSEPIVIVSGILFVIAFGVIAILRHQTMNKTKKTF